MCLRLLFLPKLFNLSTWEYYVNTLNIYYRMYNCLKVDRFIEEQNSSQLQGKEEM